MNPFNSIFNIFSKKQKIELNVKKEVEIEYQLLGKIIPKGGHKVFEVDEKTGKAVEAKYKRDTIMFIAGRQLPERLLTKPGFVYIPALNVANAERKFKHNSNQAAYYYKEGAMNIHEQLNLSL